MKTITQLSTLLLLTFALTLSVIILIQNDLQLTTLPFSSDNTPTVVDSVWLQIGKDLKMNHYADSPRVKTEIRRLLADKKEFYRILNNAAPYMAYIYNQTKVRHLPAELALIPYIESEYNPNDHNSIGAMGLWQLMPATARGFGVRVKGGYDGRKNIIISTNAALSFFDELGNTFKGNWYLAIAGYNCGPGGVQKAIKRANSRDFWQLNVPLETKYYVPRLLALAAIIQNPEKYGVQLPLVHVEPYFAEIPMPKSESLSSYAKTTGTDIDILKKLNPDVGIQKVNAIEKSLLVPVNSHAI